MAQMNPMPLQEALKPRKKHHQKKAKVVQHEEEPTPETDYDTKMALAELMEAKEELKAKRKAALAQKAEPAVVPKLVMDESKEAVIVNPNMGSLVQ